MDQLHGFLLLSNLFLSFLIPENSSEGIFLQICLIWIWFRIKKQVNPDLHWEKQLDPAQDQQQKMNAYAQPWQDPCSTVLLKFLIKIMTFFIQAKLLQKSFQLNPYPKRQEVLKLAEKLGRAFRCWMFFYIY